MDRLTATQSLQTNQELISNSGWFRREEEPSCMHYPITRIDPATNTVTGQWSGAGGDSIRVAHGSVWLTNLTGAKVWRLPVPRR